MGERKREEWREEKGGWDGLGERMMGWVGRKEKRGSDGRKEKRG